MRRTRTPILVTLVVLTTGCNSGGTRAFDPGAAVLIGPDGVSRKFLEWPVDMATLKGATLTSPDHSGLTWLFNVDGTHALSNGDQPLPDMFASTIENPTYNKARTVTGRWGLKDVAGGRRKIGVTLEAADGVRPPLGDVFWVYPYHWSAEYVHFCGSSTGHGANWVFKLTPAAGQSLPSPPK